MNKNVEQGSAVECTAAHPQTKSHCITLFINHNNEEV